MPTSLLKICLVIFTFAPPGFAAIDEYYDAVDVVNAHLADLDKPNTNILCPSASFVLSCGNGVCEPRQGEDEASCGADCNSSPVKSYDNSMICREVQQFFKPKSIPEVQQLVRYAANAQVGLRVVGSRHSVNNQYCTDGIILSTVNLNKILGIEKEPKGTESVWVEPGVLLGDLAEWLHLRNRSLGYAQLGFRLATVAGAIANGTHGSSPLHNTVISNNVRAVTLIDAHGNIHEISDKYGETDAIKAARTHLGILGPIVRIKLKIVPQFRLHVKVTDGNDALLLQNGGIFRQVGTCDYALLNWFPNSHRFIKTCGNETKARAQAGAENTLLTPPLPSWLTQPYRAALHYGMCYQPLNAALEYARYLQLKWIPPFRKADDFGLLASTNEAVGYAHRMLSSALIKTQDNFFVNDWEIAVPFSRAQEALRAVSSYAHRTSLRVPLVGIFLRFTPSDDRTLLAHTTSVAPFRKREPVVFFEFATPVPMGFPDAVTSQINSTYEELARLLVTQFDGRLHWGKNKDFVFPLQNLPEIYGDNFQKFNAIREELDPNGMFLSAFDINAGF